MPDWILWPIGVALIGGIGFGIGYLNRIKEKWKAERDAEDNRARADKATKTAKVFSLPAGDKRSIVDRL